MKILLVGGGTLGPVTPLVALFEHLESTEKGIHEFLFVGTSRGPEKKVVTQAGIPFVAHPAAKLDRFLTLRLFAIPFVFVWSWLSAFPLLWRFRPKVIVSAGSYVAVPITYAAWLLRIPVVLHQLDVTPGLANRLMAPLAAAVTVSVDEAGKKFAKKKTVITGIPLRRSVQMALDFRTERQTSAIKHFGLEPDLATVLFIGGGTGALQLNSLISQVIRDLVKEVQVIHSTGLGKNAALLRHPRYKAYSLLTEDEMADAYAIADVIVSRSGMGAIAELAAQSVPFFLLPMPHSPQEKNAAFFQAQAGIPVFTASTSAQEFKNSILKVVADRRSWSGSIEKLHQLLPPRAVGRVAAVIGRVVKGESLI